VTQIEKLIKVNAPAWSYLLYFLPSFPGQWSTPTHISLTNRLTIGQVFPPTPICFWAWSIDLGFGLVPDRKRDPQSAIPARTLSRPGSYNLLMLLTV